MRIALLILLLALARQASGEQPQDDGSENCTATAVSQPRRWLTARPTVRRIAFGAAASTVAFTLVYMTPVGPPIAVGMANLGWLGHVAVPLEAFVIAEKMRVATAIASVLSFPIGYLAVGPEEEPEPEPQPQPPQLPFPQPAEVELRPCPPLECPAPEPPPRPAPTTQPPTLLPTDLVDTVPLPSPVTVRVGPEDICLAETVESLYVAHVCFALCGFMVGIVSGRVIRSLDSSVNAGGVAKETKEVATDFGEEQQEDCMVEDSDVDEEIADRFAPVEDGVLILRRPTPPRPELTYKQETMSHPRVEPALQRDSISRSGSPRLASPGSQVRAASPRRSIRSSSPRKQVSFPHWNEYGFGISSGIRLPRVPSFRNGERASESASPMTLSYGEVVVVDLTEGGPAEEAGLRESDVIDRIGSRKVSTREHVRREMESVQSKRTATLVLTVQRHGVSKPLVFKIQPRETTKRPGSIRKKCMIVSEYALARATSMVPRRESMRSESGRSAGSPSESGSPVPSWRTVQGRQFGDPGALSLSTLVARSSLTGDRSPTHAAAHAQRGRSVSPAQRHSISTAAQTPRRQSTSSESDALNQTTPMRLVAVEESEKDALPRETAQDTLSTAPPSTAPSPPATAGRTRRQSDQIVVQPPPELEESTTSHARSPSPRPLAGARPVSPRPTAQPVSPRPTPAAQRPVSPRPTTRPVSPRPTAQPVSPRPTPAAQRPVSPRPTTRPVSPRPTTQPVSPRPTPAAQRPVSPRPTTRPVSPRPTTQPASPRPTPAAQRAVSPRPARSPRRAVSPRPTASPRPTVRAPLTPQSRAVGSPSVPERRGGARHSDGSAGIRRSTSSAHLRTSTSSAGYRASTSSAGHRASTSSAGHRASTSSAGHRASTSSAGHRVGSGGPRASSSSVGLRASTSSAGPRVGGDGPRASGSGGARVGSASSSVGHSVSSGSAQSSGRRARMSPRS
eukprot:TRINITY_DN245_c0_g1_i1.p1 TRINITY_DN245_c0_g1~~TRINITY_DN245_c0_g1_i1.p1  ORF type:complete len:963 (+),score=106.36 TRINITY_DN245_c0_g1_i1:62-2950(+)